MIKEEIRSIFIKAIRSLTNTSYYMEALESGAMFTFIEVLFVVAVLGAILAVRLVEVYFDL